jgi:hypothetical protein
MKEILDFMVSVLKKINLSFSSNSTDGQKLSLDVEDDDKGIRAGVSIEKEKGADPNIMVSVGQKKTNKS